jgi:hypothetical protein
LLLTEAANDGPTNSSKRIIVLKIEPQRKQYKLETARNGATGDRREISARQDRSSDYAVGAGVCDGLQLCRSGLVLVALSQAGA